jgi:hypothetical protein
MYPPVITKDPKAVEGEVQAAYLSAFAEGDRQFVPRSFEWAVECFSGQYKDYQPVDAPYHDLEHTLQGTLCMARLLRGRHRAGALPQLTEPIFQLGLLAMLLHDTGYLKQDSDKQGTGAKYTVIHVQRSAIFAADLLATKGFNQTDIKAVQNMIHCTGVNVRLSVIPFQSELERIAGFALGTADLLGQMAADDYVEKLPMLFEEFAEAAQHSKDKSDFVNQYSSAEDLMQKTPRFWENFVQVKLERDFGGLSRYLNEPYPDGPNPYRQRIEANMARLRKRLAPAMPTGT